MRNVLFLIIGLIAGALLTVVFYHPSSSFLFAPAIAVFSPGATDEVVAFIDSSRKTLDVEMYVFSSDELLDALKRARARGVSVRVILEKRVMSEQNVYMYEQLLLSGIDVYWASENYKLTHSKFMVADSSRLLVGSHNFSDSAMEYNREASVILEGPVVAEFVRVFEEDWELAA